MYAVAVEWHRKQVECSQAPSPRGGRFCLLDVELFGAVIGCKLLLLFVGALCVEVRDAVQGRGMRVRAIY